jgi:Zn-dependent metalloprotease
VVESLPIPNHGSDKEGEDEVEEDEENKNKNKSKRAKKKKQQMKMETEREWVPKTSNLFTLVGQEVEKFDYVEKKNSAEEENHVKLIAFVPGVGVEEEGRNLIRDEEDAQRRTDVTIFLVQEEERETPAGRAKLEEKGRLTDKANKEEKEIELRISKIRERIRIFHGLRYHMVEQAGFISLLREDETIPNCEPLMEQTDKRIKVCTDKMSVLRDMLHVQLVALEELHWAISKL